MSRALLALAAVVLLAGCGGDPETSAEASSKEACAQAERVTDTYRDALGDAGSPQDAAAIISGAVSGLRDIETAPPLSMRIDAVADALAGLLTAVQAGTPPAQLQSKAEAIGTSTTALAQACGRPPAAG